MSLVDFLVRLVEFRVSVAAITDVGGEMKGEEAVLMGGDLVVGREDADEEGNPHPIAQEV